MAMTHLAPACDASLFPVRVYGGVHLLAVGQRAVGELAAALRQDLLGGARRGLVFWSLVFWFLRFYLKIYIYFNKRFLLMQVLLESI